MTFLNIFHRILVKKNHFGRFGQVSGGGDTSEPRVSPIKVLVTLIYATEGSTELKQIICELYHLRTPNGIFCYLQCKMK